MTNPATIMSGRRLGRLSRHPPDGFRMTMHRRWRVLGHHLIDTVNDAPIVRSGRVRILVRRDSLGVFPSGFIFKSVEIGSHHFLTSSRHHSPARDWTPASTCKNAFIKLPISIARSALREIESNLLATVRSSLCSPKVSFGIGLLCNRAESRHRSGIGYANRYIGSARIVLGGPSPSVACQSLSRTVH